MRLAKPCKEVYNEARASSGTRLCQMREAQAQRRRGGRAVGRRSTVEKITDINEITGFGVMMTPALAIDGEVKSVGKVLSSEDIQKLLA